MRTYEPFRYTFYVGTVKEDLTELCNCDDYAWSHEQKNRGEGRLGEPNFHVLDSLLQTKHLLERYVNDALHNNYKYVNDFRITTSWITNNNPGENIRPHHHKNSFYSGVLYHGDYWDDSGSLIFKNPIGHASPIELYSDANPMNDSIGIPPRKNLMILFPSCITHHCYDINRERISLAFNIMPTGTIGRSDSTCTL
jgi:hypothetical protein